MPPLAVVAVTDARTGRIPDAANAAIAVLGLARALAGGPLAPMPALLDAAITVCLVLLLRRAYHAYRGRQGLGLGDVKFLGAATLWTGLAGLPFLVLAASLAALLGLGVAGSVRGGLGWTTRLRFGPYLAAALLAVVVLLPAPPGG